MKRNQTFTRKMSLDLARKIQKRDNYIVYVYFKGYLSNLDYKVIDADKAKEFNKHLDYHEFDYEILASNYFNTVFKDKRTLTNIGDFLYQYINQLIRKMEINRIYDGVYVSVLEYKNHHMYEDSLHVDFYQRVFEEENVMYIVELEKKYVGNKYKKGLFTLVGDRIPESELKLIPKSSTTKVYKNEDGTYTQVVGEDGEGQEVVTKISLKEYKGESYKETNKNKRTLMPIVE